jgi:GT2 family glycosyltransferase
MEEIDLCWRLQQTGYDVYYCSNSIIYHLGGGTLNGQSPYKTFLNYRNNLLLLYKNLPADRVWPIIFFRLILDGISALRFLVKGNLQGILAILKAHFAFYFRFRHWHSRRRQVQQQVSKQAQLFPKSIVGAYFLKGKKTYLSVIGMKKNSAIE